MAKAIVGGHRGSTDYSLRSKDKPTLTRRFLVLVSPIFLRILNCVIMARTLGNRNRPFEF
ncbi:hypothetical protein BKA82DRAFT_1005782 [Pisolithus tinctorius]|uniref:Uncharacterized protein n=1 Tax=Pisolithus tinctorius Marx 270 TaxID=870435 RepID=A0A0C3NQM9_PISTI|nr:hypothetical protein BKA82DRAFT_1005782 [Pisolithus tinctorius]KIN97820.1 hypothetical protein M404DRAFT_1005782 [Pisolithus tinctorius Marx 270]